MVKKKENVTSHQWQLIVMSLIFLIIGIFVGQTIAVASFMEVASSVRIDEFTVELNETEMIDAMFDYMNKSGMLEEITNGQTN